MAGEKIPCSSQPKHICQTGNRAKNKARYLSGTVIKVYCQVLPDPITDTISDKLIRNNFEHTVVYQSPRLTVIIVSQEFRLSIICQNKEANTKKNY